MELCEDVVTTVEYSWVTNYNDPNYGLVANGLRYYTPVEYNGNPIAANHFDSDPNIGVRWGDSPLGGAHIFLIGGLSTLSWWSPDANVRQRALDKARILFPILDDNARWNKWFYCVPENRLPN